MKSQAVSANAVSVARGSMRLYYLDWLRVLAILTVFVYHTTRFFNLEDWHVKNATMYGWLEVWNRAAVIWMMPLIFVISGASLFFAVGKGGAGKFVKDKVLRLLVPLLFADVTHCSLQVYLERVTHGQFSGSYFQFLPQYFTGIYDGDNPAAGNFALTGMHLWYLFWLFLFSLLLYPLLSWLKGRGRGVLGKMGDLLAVPGAVYVLVVPTVLLLVFASPDGLVMDLEEAGWSLFVYLWLLFCGFLLVSSEGVQASALRLRWASLAIGAALSAAYLWLSFQPGGFSYGTLPYALIVGLEGARLLVPGIGVPGSGHEVPERQHAVREICQRSRVAFLHHAPDGAAVCGLLCRPMGHPRPPEVADHRAWQLRHHHGAVRVAGAAVQRSARAVRHEADRQAAHRANGKGSAGGITSPPGSTGTCVAAFNNGGRRFTCST